MIPYAADTPVTKIEHKNGDNLAMASTTATQANADGNTSFLDRLSVPQY